jgi:hypothetical protein
MSWDPPWPITAAGTDQGGGDLQGWTPTTIMRGGLDGVGRGERAQPMRRGCLFGVVGILGLCIIACILGYTVGLPRLRENAREPLEEAIGTQIARQIAPNPGVAPAPGTYVIAANDINAGLREELGDSEYFDEVAVAFAPGGFTVRFTANERDTTYSGNVTAADGRLEVTDMTDEGLMTFFFPANEVEKALENVINNYLAANGLRLTAAELGEGTLTLTTEAA